MTRALLAAALVLAAGAAPAAAQATRPEPGRRVARASVPPQRVTLQRMMKRVTVNFEDASLRDAVAFIVQVTGAEIEPVWDDGSGNGLDPEQLVAVHADDMTALDILERLLHQASDGFGFGGGATWQMTEWGAMKIGPKEILNQDRYVRIYPISDLIYEIPDFTDAPKLDLNSVLQSSQGGGGQSPFQQNNDTDRERLTPEERAQPIVDMLVNLVEPEQWEDNGGSGASVRYWQGALLVNAPDYIHRGIDGYPYWPAEYTVARTVDSRRYVTMSIDTGISTVDGFAQDPVTAVVPGQSGGGDPPPPPPPP